MNRLVHIFAATLLAAPVTDVSAQRSDEDAKDALGVVWLTGPIQLMRDECMGLFPKEADFFRESYEASAVAEYAVRLALETTPQPPRDREARLKSLGMSDDQAFEWCHSSYPETLRDFDARYKGRTDEISAAVAKFGELLAAKSARSTPAPPDPRFAEVLYRIVEASNRAYESGDWSTFASLYRPGSLACWGGNPEAELFNSFLVAAIPATATYEVTEYNNFGFGYEFEGPPPDFLMEIRYELSSAAGRCGLDRRRRWPTHQFLLVRQGDAYELTHYCPDRESSEVVATNHRLPPSAARSASNIKLLTADDWKNIPLELQKDRYFPPSIDRLQREHNLSEAEAHELADYVCDPSNSPP
jgi:hypothetical protein